MARWQEKKTFPLLPFTVSGGEEAENRRNGEGEERRGRAVKEERVKDRGKGEEEER